jgi:hypothetical protein
MKKVIILLLSICTLSIYSSCSSKKSSELQCKNEVRAYEFGREMHSVVNFGALDLESAIKEYENSLGVSSGFDADNECVVKGFEDAENGIKSPFNKTGKSWTSF